MKKLLYSLMIMTLSIGCTRDQRPGVEEEEKPKAGGEITFDITFEPSGDEFRRVWNEGDAIGLYAATEGKPLAASGNYIDNVCLIFDGTSWTSATPLNWPDGGAKLDFYACYPYDAATDPTKIAFGAQEDQMGAGFNQSLLMAAKAAGKAEGSAVRLPFSHLMAMVQFTIDDELDVFESGEEISVTLQGVKLGATLDLNADSGAKVASGDATDIKMRRVADAEGYVFRALIPAQTMGAGAKLFLIASDRTEFESSELTGELTFVAGKMRALTEVAPLPDVVGNVVFTNGETAEVLARRSPDGSHEFEGDGSGSRTVYSIELTGKTYLIGRDDDETVTLKLDDEGSLLFRDADSDGNIPIGSYAEFALINSGEESLAGSYIQDSELDLLGAASLMATGLDRQSWIPVGNATAEFTGRYESEHPIANLYINASEVEDIGLFGVAGTGGSLKGIEIVSGSVTGKNHTGGVCGFNKGTIDGCSFAGEVKGHWEVGGVCGWNEGTESVITGSHNEGTVTGTGDRVGGVCGMNYGSITDSFNDDGGTIRGVNNVGGVCGRNLGSISGTYNEAATNGGWEVGGVCGYNTTDSSLSGSHNTGAVKGSEDRVGGVCGWNRGLVSECYNASTVEGNTRVGGVSGQNDSDIFDCNNTGAVTGLSNMVGGVCGWNSSGEIKGSDNSGAVTGATETDGVCGRNNGTITDCTNTGVVKETVVTLEKIEITTRPDKTSYFVNELFDPTGMVVTAYYSDGSTEELMLTEGNFTYDFSTVGTNKSVRITWGGKTADLGNILVAVKSYGPEELVLGRGYDVTGMYAYSPEIKQPILDFGALEAVGWIKHNPNLAESEFSTTEGHTATQYSESLGLRAGVKAEAGFMGASFQSEISSHLSREELKYDTHSFSITSSRITRDAWYVEYRDSPEKMRTYASAQFLDDLKNKKPAEIIALYGTHVMLGGIWGARLDYKFEAEKKADAYSTSGGFAFSNQVSADVKAITVGGGTSTEFTTEFSSMYDAGSVERYTRAIGGDPEWAIEVHNSQDYEAWTRSIDGNEVWCDYYPNSLMPIYELVPSDKRAAIKKAYDDYLRDKVITVSSALHSGVTDYDFMVRGNNSNVAILNGDGDVDTQNNKTTMIYVTVTLSKRGGDINARYVLRVEEGGNSPDKSILVMTEDVLIPTGKSDIRLDENPLTYSAKFTCGWKQHVWWNVSIDPEYGEPCPFMRNNEWGFMIDGNGDDVGRLEVSGKVRIKYSYMGV